MKHRQSVDKLAKFIVYVLGRRPDEFGLCPDELGYVKTKALMKVFTEESGWRHVRLTDIHEIIHGVGPPVVEIRGSLIRAVDRSRLILPDPAATIPKLLYYAVRRRAHPTAMRKGVSTGSDRPQLLLARREEMALRLGRRIDASPVILTVHTACLRQHRLTLLGFGTDWLLTDAIPPGCLSGPPLPARRTEPLSKDESQVSPSPKTPGSFLLDLNDPTATARSKRASQRNKHPWKKDRTIRRRRDPHRWGDE